MELNKIYNQDCLIGMQFIPDTSVDMILCDLPYGTTQNKWDSVIDLSIMWQEYERIIKDNGAIVLTAQTPFDKILGASNVRLLKYEWIWCKNVSTGHLNANMFPMKQHENILVFFKKPPVYNPQKNKAKPYYMKRKPINDNGSNYGDIIRTETINKGERHPTSLLYFDREIGIHPTQKPVPLFEYLIKTYTNEGETVLDNCMGSGTTAIACINTKRNYIGFEKDFGYHSMAEERVRTFLSYKHMNPTLF